MPRLQQTWHAQCCLVLLWALEVTGSLFLTRLTTFFLGKHHRTRTCWGAQVAADLACSVLPCLALGPRSYPTTPTLHYEAPWRGLQDAPQFPACLEDGPSEYLQECSCYCLPCCDWSEQTCPVSGAILIGQSRLALSTAILLNEDSIELYV